MTTRNTQDPNLSDWVTINYCAAFLGVDRKTVSRYISTGLLSARRVGPRLIRVSRESLKELGQPVGGAR